MENSLWFLLILYGNQQVEELLMAMCAIVWIPNFGTGTSKKMDVYSMEVCFFLMRNSLFLKEFTADISYLHANAIVLCIYVKLFPCHNSTGIQPILAKDHFPRVQ